MTDLAEQFDQSIAKQINAVAGASNALLTWQMATAKRISDAVSRELTGVPCEAGTKSDLEFVFDTTEKLRTVLATNNSKGYEGHASVNINDEALLDLLIQLNVADQMVANAAAHARTASDKHSEAIKADPSFGRTPAQPVVDNSHLLGADLQRQLAQNKARGERDYPAKRGRR